MTANTERGLLSRAIGMQLELPGGPRAAHKCPAIGWCDEVHQRAAAPRFDSCAAADARGEIAEPALRPARSCAGWAIFGGARGGGLPLGKVMTCDGSWASSRILDFDPRAAALAQRVQIQRVIVNLICIAWKRWPVRSTANL
jgi:hypothetical protein